MVARVVRDDEAAGSNPVTPTNTQEGSSTRMVPLVVSGAGPAACAAWRSHGEFQVIVRPRGPPLPYDLRVGSWGPCDRVIRHLGVTVVARLDGRRRRTAVVAAVLGGAYLVALTVLSVLTYTGDTSVLAADGAFSSVLGAMTLTPGVLPQITGLMYHTVSL